MRTIGPPIARWIHPWRLEVLVNILGQFKCRRWRRQYVGTDGFHIWHAEGPEV